MTSSLILTKFSFVMKVLPLFQIFKMSYPTNSPSLPHSSLLYSSLQTRLDTLQYQLSLTRHYIDTLATATATPAPPGVLSEKQDHGDSDTDTDTAYLVQLPTALVLAVLATLLSGVLYTAITRVHSIAMCGAHRQYIIDTDTVVRTQNTDTDLILSPSQDRTLDQVTSVGCELLSHPVLLSQVLVWGPVLGIAVIMGILITDVELLGDAANNTEESNDDYQEIEDAEVIRINKLIEDFGNIRMDNNQLTSSNIYK